MLKGIIPMPWWMRRPTGPKIYDVLCPKCGWRKTVELGEVDVESRSVDGGENAMQTRETLPSRCPKCGGRLKKRRLKVFLRY